MGRAKNSQNAPFALSAKTFTQTMRGAFYLAASPCNCLAVSRATPNESEANRSHFNPVVANCLRTAQVRADTVVDIWRAVAPWPCETRVSDTAPSETRYRGQSA